MQLQTVLEGVPLPATKDELVAYARSQDGSGLVALLEALPEREYDSLDEVGEALQPVQPPRTRAEAHAPHEESDLPPGGAAYTDPAAEPGWVRERGPDG